MEWKMKIIYTISIVFFIIVLSSCFSSLSEKQVKSEKEESTQENSPTETKLPMDYIPMSLPQLIGRSDLIVMGKITEIDASVFTFKVEELFLNEHASDLIKIRKFIPSEILDGKKAMYGIGQEFILFLSTSEQNSGDQPYSIIGSTGEGEMPIENGFVYLEGSYLQGLERKPYEVQGVVIQVQRFELSNFKDAVQHYTECFSWELVEYIKNNKKRERWKVSVKCQDDFMKKYSDKSWMHEYLVRETIKKIPVNSNE